MVFMPRRKLYPVRLLVWLPFIFLPFFFDHGFDSAFFVVGGYSWSYMAWYAYSVFCIVFCHRAGAGNYVYVAVSAYALQNMFASLRFFLFYEAFGEENIAYSVVCFSLMVAMYAAMLFLFVLPWVKRVRMGLKVNRVVLLAFSVLVLGVLNILSSFLINTAPESISVQCLLFGICSLVIILLLATVYDRSYIQYERQMMDRLLSEQDRQRKLSQQAIDLINMKSHDLKHQLAALKDGGRPAEDFYEKAVSSIDIYDSYFKTGNSSLDLVLTEKNLLCKKNDINFTCIADGAAVDFMNAGDIYSFFGNVIDNAAECLSRYPKEKRNLSLSVRRQKGLAVIVAENYFCGEMRFEGGLPVTTKGNRDYHGFGTRSMRYIVRDIYGGNLTMRQEGEAFIVTAVMPLPAASKADKGTKNGG